MSILRSAVDYQCTHQRRPNRPPEERLSGSGNKADKAFATQRRETIADAAKTAAHTAYFLGGGRYL